MQAERLWLLTADLLLTAAVITFFLIAPVFGYPLTYDEAFRAMQIVFPVFVGYLATAVAFVVRPIAEPQLAEDRKQVLRILVRGPIFVFAIGIMIVWIVYGVSNSTYAKSGQGMTIEVFANLHTGLLSILAATTGGLIAFLFPSREDK